MPWYLSTSSRTTADSCTLLRNGTVSPDNKSDYYHQNDDACDTAKCNPSNEFRWAISTAAVAPTHRITACSQQQYNDTCLIVISVICWAIVGHKIGGEKNLCVSRSNWHIVFIYVLSWQRRIHLSTKHAKVLFAYSHLETQLAAHTVW